MKIKRLTSANILFALLLCVVSSDASPFLQDSLVRKKRPSTRNDTYWFAHDPETRYVIDSSIFRLQYYTLVQRDGAEWFNLGNVGSAAFPLIYNREKSYGFSAGFNQFDLYRYKKDSVKYYQVVRPYMELQYLIGLKNEQVLQVNFANRHKHYLFYGVDYTRVYSKGVYTNQLTNNNCFSLYGIFNSRNRCWNVQADLLFNSFINQENGGVTLDIFRRDSTVSFLNKTLAPTFFSAAQNNYKEIDFYFKTSYNFGKKYWVRESDTLRKQAVLSVFRASYQFNVASNSYKFRDLVPPTDSNSAYGNFQMVDDSVANDFKYWRYGNSFILNYTGKQLANDSSVKEVPVLAAASLTHDYYVLRENGLKNTFGNLYVRGDFRNNSSHPLKLLYSASVAYTLLGYNQNDLLLSGQLGYNFGKWGKLTAGAGYELKEADYIFQRFQSHGENWTNNFPKASYLSFGGEYVIEQFGIWYAGAHNFTVKNMPYFAAPDEPAFEGNTANILVLHGGNRFSIKGFHLDNDVWFQQISGTNKIRLPQWVTKHSIYYDVRLFKKALWLSVGFDLRYYSSVRSNAYFPLTGQFYTQDLRTQCFYPVLDFFLNFKIRTVRFFIKLDNISAYFGPKGYYTAYLHPAYDLSFRVGIKWRFFE